MTARIIRGFDHENSLADLVTGGVAITSNSTINFVAGRYGGRAITLPSEAMLIFPLGVAVASGSSVWVGLATGVKPPDAYSYATCICAVNGEGRVHCYVLITNTQVLIYRQTANWGGCVNPPQDTLLASIDTPLFAGNVFIFVAVEFIIGATAGEVHVRVNGETADFLAVTGANTLGDTASGYSTVVAIGLSGTTYSQGGQVDDFCAQDTAGSYNNSWPIERQVLTGWATADSSVEFTPLSGTTNTPMIDETAMDSDATYNVSATAGQSDLFTHTQVVPNYVISAVQITNASRKDASGAATLANIISSNGTDDTGATNAMISTYAYYSDISETDPATGAPWTAAAHNASLMGYGRVA